MARTPSFKVKNTSDGWRVNVPATLSETGKRSQRFFSTRDKASDFAKDLRDSYKTNGSQIQILSAGATEDAAMALEILKNFEVNLTTCARFYVQTHEARAKAPILSEAWEQAIALRKKLSTRHLGALKNWKRRFVALGNTNIVDLNAAAIEEVLSEVTDGTTAWKNGLRYLSVILSDQVKKGTLKENPCKRVSPIKTKRIDEVVIYEIDQLKSLFKACKDYSDGKDRKCSECAVPFAFLAFAGIRPEELPKLVWSNVANGYIRISGNVAKKDRIRNVRINKTLESWIALVPEGDRSGRIVPGRWTQRATRVKREAGLDGRHLQDALRHSFASYSFPLETNLNDLMSDMGHLDWKVYYDHYHNAKTKEEAAVYWHVTPQSVFCD
jgi:integrase